MAVVLRQTYPTNAHPRSAGSAASRSSGETVGGVEFFLEHDGVVYPRPIPTEPDGLRCVCFPRRRARYVLHAFWRDADGRPRPHAARHRD